MSSSRRAAIVAAVTATVVCAGVYGAVTGGAADRGVPAAKRAAKAVPGVRGNFSLVMMVHTLDVPKTTPWAGSFRQGAAYSYRSIACNGNAPVNNISSDLPSYNGRVAGSSLPQSLRGQPFAFRTVKTRKYGWVMRGTITITVCQLKSGPTPTPDPVPDESKPKIRVSFQAKPRIVNAEDATWHGSFRLVGGTGRYAGLTGGGQIAGYFLCFAGCSKFGYYHDAQFVMHGTYADRTPELAAG